MNTKKILLAWSFIVAGGFFACGSEDVPSYRTGKICLAVDMSFSADENAVPRLEIAHIDSIISVLQKAGGGSISVLPIQENSIVPIRRLTLTPLSGTLKQQALIIQSQRAAIEDFRQEVNEILIAPRQATITDLNGALLQLNRLFNEPTLGGPQRKICVLLTDLIDDAKRHQPVPLGSDVTILLVGRHQGRDLKKLGKHVYEFEGLAAAIDYCKGLILQKEGA